jgi:hypothetical protein
MQNSGSMVTEPCPICGEQFTEFVETRWGMCPDCKEILISVANGIPAKIPESMQKMLDEQKV